MNNLLSNLRVRFQYVNDTQCQQNFITVYYHVTKVYVVNKALLNT